MTSDGPLVNLDFEETNAKANFPAGSTSTITTVIAAVHHPEREATSNRSLANGGTFVDKKRAAGGGGGGEPALIRSANVDKSKTKQHEINVDLSSGYDRISVNCLSTSTATTEELIGSGTGPSSLSLIPEVHFEGITLDSGIDRESQPLLGGREHEITYNQFPGE